MYKRIIRPLLFLLPPESIHHLLLSILKFLFRIPGFSYVTRKVHHSESDVLETEFLGMKFTNPVGMAAGFDKNGEVFREFSHLGFSHIEVGTVTPKAQPGNEKPRSFRIRKDQGLINRMGFNNHGVDALADKLRSKRPPGLIIGGNIGKNTLTPNTEAVSDYEKCFTALYGLVDYFVVNVSCPNISDLHELQDQDGLEKILGRLAELRKQKESYIPVLLKISPDLNMAQIDTSIQMVRKYGIDGIVATNTTIQREGLKTPEDKIQKIGNGGMSGGPLTSRSLGVVKYISEKTGGELPIIGVGGIMTARDALNMLEAGATLVQVYTGFIYQGPGFVRRINKHIRKYKMSSV